MSTARTRRSSLLQLAFLGVVGVLAVVLLAANPQATATTFPAALAKPVCGPGALKETSIDGRVPSSDYTSGRAAKGYRCNTAEVSHSGAGGGYKVLRYVDPAGHVCAFYDTTLLFPKDVLDAGQGLGVDVLDMSDPAHPRRTASLVTPAMLNPHESLLVNAKRGILAATLGSPATAPGLLDLYDVRTDCRHPRLLSSTPTAILGHESGFSPDGNTFYAASASLTLTAIDISNPVLPRTLMVQPGVTYHGLRLSPDGRTMYVANIGSPSLSQFSTGGLQILDVSEIQDRKPNPQVHVLGSVTWPEHSIPQVAQPFTRGGHRYLFEVDEFSNFNLTQGGAYMTASPVGAARIIDVQDPQHPFVVSDLRLAAHQPAARSGAEQNDPGANVPVQGYAAHYCSLPTQTDPTLAACSMILSGLRIFDIRDVHHPREVGYFNRPTMPGAKVGYPIGGAFAMSQPAWDVARHSIWYSDANAGFFDVKVTNGAWPAS